MVVYYAGFDSLILRDLKSSVGYARKGLVNGTEKSSEAPCHALLEAPDVSCLLLVLALITMLAMFS